MMPVVCIVKSYRDQPAMENVVSNKCNEERACGALFLLFLHYIVYLYNKDNLPASCLVCMSMCIHSSHTALDTTAGVAVLVLVLNLGLDAIQAKVTLCSCAKKILSILAKLKGFDFYI